MIDLISLIQDILGPLQWSLNWINILEIALIVVILFVFYKKFIQNTQSEKLVKGLFFLVFAWIISEILILIDLSILGVFLKSLVTLIALSLIVIFQPELRRLLGYLGPDSACLVVSEETGDVSVCMDGILKKYEDLMTLKTDLESILGIKPENTENKHKTLLEMLKNRGGNQK